jgi:hypothetical protein
VQRRGQLGHPADAHEHNAEDHVVNVRVTRDDVARPPPDLGADHPDRQADKTESHDQRHEEAKQR